MKRIAFLFGCLAAAVSAFAGTGVTQKELTNAVNAVRSELTTFTTNEVGSLRTEVEAEFLTITNGGAVVSYPAMTNYVKEATQALTNISAYVRHEELDGATNEVMRQMGVAVQGAKNYADGKDTQVANTAQHNLTNAIGHVMEFIEADLDDSEPTFNPDGSITIVHIDYSLGYPHRVKIRLMPMMEPSYSDKMGLRVVSSSYSGIPEGTQFACIGDGTEFYNRTKGTINWQVATNTSAGSSMPYYRFYGNLSGGLVMDSNNAYLTDFNQVLVCRGTATMSNLVGSFTVEPIWMTDEEYTAVAGNAVPAEQNEWVERVEPTLLGYHYGFQQLDNLNARKNPYMLKATGDLPTYMNIPSRPNAPKYNWNELYPLEDDDYYWEPEEWYKAEDWNHPYAWITFPVQVSIPYEYDGQTYTKIKVVNDLGGLMKYFNVIIPPTPYKSPEKKKKRDFCKEGQHIYVNCKCTKCGKTRSHTYQPCGVYDSNCAQCENYNTKVTVTAHGELKPDGTTDVRCTHICDEAIVAYHTGWHHQNYGQDDTYTCACKCGTYSASKVKLAHNYEDESEITHWEDLNDGQHHYGTVECMRGNCRHEKDVIKDHEVEVQYDEETGEPTNVFPYNDDNHVIKGDCTKCTARNLDHHLEPHHFIAVDVGEEVTWKDGTTFTADEPFCYCNICWDSTYHNYQAQGLHDIVYLSCGNITNCIIFCARCGYLVAHNEHDFRSENKYLDDLYHDCYCGLHQHKHKINETSEKCEGGYHWVAEYDEYGREIDGYWVECETGVDDGCEHDWKEDDPTGTGDIPCDNGRGYDSDNPPPADAKHIAQGGVLNASSTSHPYRAEGDGCRYHTKSLSTGGYSIEWDDEVTIRWMMIKSGPFFVTGLYPFPVQWGTKRFNGSSTMKPKSFRVMRYATWVEWWDN